MMKTKLTLAFIACTLFLITGSLRSQTAGNPGSPSSWSIIASYTIPGKASGLAWDGTYIYFGIYGLNGNQVYKFDPATGTNTQQCTGNFPDAFGMSYKSPNLLTVNQPSNSSQPSVIEEFTLSGTQVSTITLPDHYMSGVAYDAGNYWVCTYYPDNGIIYHINGSGAILSQFTPPNSQPWDICTQGSNLWIADYYGNMLYKVSTTGALLESHPTQTTAPSGIVFDGTYLWYCDGPLGSNSTIYKVDLSGSGTPAINVPVVSHNYGNVTVNNSLTWNCQVQNTGTASLVITSVGIPSGQPVSTTLTLPATITAGNSLNIPLTYHPLTAGGMNTQVSINSNDPVHPSVDVALTGNAVYSGPHLVVTNATLNWGSRRAGAWSRLMLPLLNNGDQPLNVTGLTFSDPRFTADPAVTLPATIASMQTVNLGVWFHPVAGTTYSGTLDIASNDPLSPLTVQLHGMGVDSLYPIGTNLWSYMIAGGFDNSPKSIHSIPDVTGDGVDDVIVGSEDYYIRCFNGNASVTGDVIWSYLTTAGSGSVYQQNDMDIISDIDNDGFKDVIIGTTGGNESIIALSGKTGVQLWRHDTHEYGSGGWVYQVDAKYDYNNDGFPDVLASTGDDGNGTGPKRIYCLNGKTGVPIWECPTGGPNFAVIGVSDFTGDQKPDVIAGASNAAETSGRVYGIDGSNGQIKWTSTPAGSSVWALLQIDDVTGDGIPDVASGDFNGQINFHNAVTGFKEKTTSIGNVIILRFQDMGDVNKDGHPDFMVAHSGVSATMMNGYTDATLWVKPVADKPWNVTNMGDISFDGVNDAGVGTLYQNNFSYFMDGSTGASLKSVSSSSPVDALSSIPDITGDQTMELMVGGREGELNCLSGGYNPSIGIEPHGTIEENEARIFPNPSRDAVTLVLKGEATLSVSISITDLAGKNISNFTMPQTIAGETKYSIPGEAFGKENARGIYLMNVTSGSKQYHFKIIRN